MSTETGAVSTATSVHSALFEGGMRTLTTLVSCYFGNTLIIEVLVLLRYSNWIRGSRACEFLKFDWLILILSKFILFFLVNRHHEKLPNELCVSLASSQNNLTK